MAKIEIRRRIPVLETICEGKNRVVMHNILIGI